MKELIDFTVLAIIYFLVFYRKWKAQGRDILFINTVMYIYLAFVLYFTLMPIITSLPFIFNHPYAPMNFEPFIDLSLGRSDSLRQIILNIIMTIPFGLLLPLVQRQRPSLAKTLLYTFLLSLTIELLQPLINNIRRADITDIITNVLGGAIGYLLYLIFRPLFTKFLSSLKPNHDNNPTKSLHS